MPLPRGTRYRMKKTEKGTVRLAFNKGGKVIEAKNMDTGDKHVMNKARSRKSKR